MTKEIVRTKTSKNAETLMAVYIYIYIDTFTNKWNSLTRPHTHSLQKCAICHAKITMLEYIYSSSNTSKEKRK